jgi:hypothetical protein
MITGLMKNAICFCIQTDAAFFIIWFNEDRLKGKPRLEVCDEPWDCRPDYGITQRPGFAGRSGED